MKGIVYRESIALVEEHFSIEVADDIITSSALSLGGAYTSVGTHPHQEMVALVTRLSEIARRGILDLLHYFGRHLFQRFLLIHSDFIKTQASAFELL